ncbi:MAG: glycoside hydrolase family 32 protein, partial [Bacteroidota bacterium]
CIGWMSNWKYALTTPAYSWRHMMTIPKELSIKTIGGEMVLIQNPIRELEKYRVMVLDIAGRSIDVLNSKLINLSMDAYEIIAYIQYGSDVESFGFQLRKSEEEETVVGYWVKSQTVYLDRTKSGGIDFHKDFPNISKTVFLDENHSIMLRIYVDSASIEVFVGDGRKVITDTIFTSPDSLGMQFFCNGNANVVYDIKIHKLSILY